MSISSEERNRSNALFVPDAAITSLILETIEELNMQLLPEGQMTISPTAKLLGEGGPLDSLGLVNLILLVEERVQETFGVMITLSDDQAIAWPESPFRDVPSLTAYVSQLVVAAQAESGVHPATGGRVKG